MVGNRRQDVFSEWPVIRPETVGLSSKQKCTWSDWGSSDDVDRTSRDSRPWARAYFCATVGAVDETAIKAYIESQKWDEDDQGFKITSSREA